jgi:hypothetical protein
MLDSPKKRVGSLTKCASNERRRHERYPFTSAAEVVVPETQTRIHGRTSDLSRGGCFLDTTSCFPAGSTVTIRLTKDNRTFEADAEVVYSLVGMGMGIKFTGAEIEHFGTVEKWMAELGGESLPERVLPQSSGQSCASEGPGNQEYDVLSELVMELMKERVLSNVKCQAMLQKLNPTGHSKSN